MFRGFGVPGLALCLVWGVGMLVWLLLVAPPLGVDGSYFDFFSIIFVCVSVVSGLFFYRAVSRRISASFLSALSFSVPKSANGAAGDGFFSWLIKSVVTRAAAEPNEIPGIAVF